MISFEVEPLSTVSIAPRPARRRKRAGGRQALWLLVAAAAVFLVGLRTFGGFLPPVESVAEDGFQGQMLYVLGLLQNGSLVEGARDDGALVWVHTLRLLAVAPLLAAELVLGPPGSLFLLLLALLPLIGHAFTPDRRLIALFPLFMPLFVSGRAVLVAIGVGYLILFLLRPQGRAWLFWLGLLFANLSSASMITAALLLLFVRIPRSLEVRGSFHRGAGLALVCLSLGVSIIDKIVGFQSGSAGYAAHAFESDNLLLVVISRGTLLVSLVDGQYARAAVYLLIAGYVASKLLALLRNPNAALARRILWCCIPGVLMEGLGVLAMFFPVLWLFAGALSAMPKARVTVKRTLTPK